jgi:hypothetical protein
VSSVELPRTSPYLIPDQKERAGKAPWPRPTENTPDPPFRFGVIRGIPIDLEDPGQAFSVPYRGAPVRVNGEDREGPAQEGTY